MRNTSARHSFPAGNPIANALVIIAGVLAIAASIVLGFFAFVVLSAIVLITAAIVGIRVWWIRQKLRRHGAAEPGPGPRHSGESVIEGEYRVVHKDRDEA